MTAKEKNKLAGIFLMIHGGLLAFIYLIMIAFFGIIFTADPDAPRAVFGIMTIFIAVFSAIFVAPQIIGGWKMYKEQPNAKNWGIVASILACMNAPLGTAAGVFALIFLFGEDGKKFYEGLSNKNFLPAADFTSDFQYQQYQQQQNRQYQEPPDWR